MKLKRFLPYLLALLILLLFITSFYIATNYMNNNPDDEEDEINTQACLDIGCPKGTIYVGSANSDKYYACDCGYVKNILPENLVCFSSSSDAEELGYGKVEC